MTKHLYLIFDTHTKVLIKWAQDYEYKNSFNYYIMNNDYGWLMNFNTTTYKYTIT